MTDGASRAPTEADLRELLRRLAETETLEHPVLSVYLDMRPEATGQSPGRRAALTLLRDRLNEITEAYGVRGADAGSLQADRERIESFVDGELDPTTEGLAIFACSGLDLWEVVEAGIPFRDSVGVGPRADLFQLARLLDEHETAVVAVVDSNTARLFVLRAGALEEVDGPDAGTESFRRGSMGGWSQARYQRHIDKHIADFAGEAAAALERLVDAEGARRVILAGDEVAIAPLEEALSKAVRDKVGEVIRIDIRAPRDDVAAEVRPILERLEAEDGRSVADLAVAGARAGDLGVLGVGRTQKYLEQGAVDTLVLLGLPGDPPERETAHDARTLQDRDDIAEEAETSKLDLDRRNELVRLAALTSATVEVVEEHPDLEAAGGVGAILRYRPD